jgi:hypothetical protein
MPRNRSKPANAREHITVKEHDDACCLFPQPGRSHGGARQLPGHFTVTLDSVAWCKRLPPMSTCVCDL